MISFIAWLSYTTPCARQLSLSSRFSVFRSSRMRVLCTMCRITSLLNGFAMKSVAPLFMASTAFSMEP